MGTDQPISVELWPAADVIRSRRGPGPGAPGPSSNCLSPPPRQTQFEPQTANPDYYGIDNAVTYDSPYSAPVEYE